MKPILNKEELTKYIEKRLSDINTEVLTIDIFDAKIEELYRLLEEIKKYI